MDDRVKAPGLMAPSLFITSARSCPCTSYSTQGTQQVGYQWPRFAHTQLFFVELRGLHPTDLWMIMFQVRENFCKNLKNRQNLKIPHIIHFGTAFNAGGGTLVLVSSAY